VYGITIGDFNGDKHKDVLMGGNFYGLKPQAGRFDASYGVTLAGDGGGNFKYVPCSESGAMIEGEARKIVQIEKANGGTYIIAAMNNAPLLIFEQNNHTINGH
jgi:hypothetical protein